MTLSVFGESALCYNLNFLKKRVSQYDFVRNFLFALALSSGFFSRVAFGEDLHLFMSSSHVSNATPVSYSFRIYDQSKNPGQWIQVNDGKTVYQSYPENSVSAVEVSVGDNFIYYGFLDSSSPQACHNFFPIGSPD